MTIKLVSFDVYMALIDIQGSLTPVVVDALGLAREEAGDFLRLWRAKQMERAAASNSLGLVRTPFRDCTRMGLDYVLAGRGIELPAERRRDLVMAWDAIEPWPEACGVVAEVKRRGYRTAILSNGDRDMLAALAKPFGDDMDHILSAESAGVYKPHPAVYHLPKSELGIAKADVLHVAGSGNDVIGAIASGMRCYWSNRSAERVLDPAYPPTEQGSDLTGVLALL